jgi:hypothetical protein
LTRLLRHRAFFPAVIAVALALVLPSFAVGFFSDDHAMLAVLQHPGPEVEPWWDLYRFTPNDPSGLAPQIHEGLYPWWTAPSLHLHLVRPLGGALVALDYLVFGRSAVGYHVHSLLWFVAFLAVVGALFRRVLPRETAALAFLVVALSDAVVAPASWIAARHGFVSAVPALLGLIALVRLRTDGWRPGRWLAPLGFAVGLLGGETALGVVALAIAYDLLARRDVPGRDRLARAAPHLGLALGYVAIYVAVGGGARSSAGYLEPFSDPVAFAAAAVIRFPALIADAVFSMPAELVTIGLGPPQACIGVVGALIVAALWRGCAAAATGEERAAVRWAVPGALAALATCVGAFPGGRLLLIANVGFAMLLATILRHAFRARSGALVSWSLRVGAGVLALLHFVAAPLMTLGNMKTIATMARATETAAHDATREAAGASRAFILAGSDPMATVYSHFVLLDEGATSIACWSWLDGAKSDAKVTRTAPDAFAIEPVGTTFLRGSFETLYRAPSIPIAQGDTFEQCGASIRVASMSEGHPSRIEVSFGAPLDAAPDVALLAWQAGALRRFVLPAVGASAVIPWSPGPSGLF